MTPPHFFSFDQEPHVNFHYEIDSNNNYYLTNVEGQKQNGDFVEIDEIKNSWSKERIPMKVSKTAITEKLKKKFGFTNIPLESQVVDRFKYVVEAIVKMTTGSGHWGDAFDGTTSWQNRGLSSYNVIVKFLDVADASGFYDKSKRTRTKYVSKDIKDKKKKKQQTDLQEFMKLDTVVEWRGRKWDEAKQEFVASGDPKFKDPQEHKAKTLWRALILLDMTPDQFLAGTVTGEDLNNAQKIKSLTTRLQEKTFQAVGIEKQAFPNKISLFDYAYMTDVPTEADIPDIEEKMVDGKIKLHRVQFGQQRDARFDPSKNGVMKQLTLVMRHFAESNGVTGAWTRLWSQKTPTAQHGKLTMDAHYLRDFEECLKNADVSFDADGNWTTYEHELRKQYNDRKTKGKRTIQFPNKDSTPEKYRGKKIEYKKGDFVPYIQVNGNVIDPAKKVTIDGNVETQKTPYYNVKKIVTNKKDWQYAYFYYKGAMELGWRAEEAFTSGANRSTKEKETGVAEITSQEIQEVDGKDALVDVKTLTLRIMTRKTAHVGEGHHGGTIVDPETQQMIRDKMALVEKYMERKDEGTGGFVYSAEEAKANGIVQQYVSREVDERLLPKTPADYGTLIDNKIHALIGEDGYFTEVGTMDLPSDAKFESPKRKLWQQKKWQIPQVVKVDSNRDKMKAIMRHCYKKVLPTGMYDDYFKFHTLHSLRHLFAQYFLKATEYDTGTKDFAMVMELGHWGGIDVLMNFYGKSDDSALARKKAKVKMGWDDMIDKERKVKEQQERDAKLTKELANVNPDTLESEDGAQVEGGETPP